MPAGKRQNDNGYLIATVVLAGLFLISAIIAILFYVKYEEQRTTAENAVMELNEVITDRQQRQVGSIVGEVPRDESTLGALHSYFNDLTQVSLGGVPEDTSAEAKVLEARSKKNSLLNEFTEQYPDFNDMDPNSTGFLQLVNNLDSNLNSTLVVKNKLEEELNKLENDFKVLRETTNEKEEELLAEKERYKQLVSETTEKYEELEELLQQTTEQQVQTLRTQLEESREKVKSLNNDLLKTEAELKLARSKVEKIQNKLNSIVPPPDKEIAAFQPDGKIIMIDDQTDIVHINLGRDEKVYRGLTFSVYNKNQPIPKDGEGKAEIEVFKVDENISAARIVNSSINEPIVKNDIIANLIWDSERPNIFVVAGEFDLNYDGQTDYKGSEKIEGIINNWGGIVENKISVDTDFVVLGQKPVAKRKPTFEEIEVDPLAMEKYEESIQQVKHYQEVRQSAKELSVPIFNTERFLHFIGYKAQAQKPGAF